MFYVCIVAKYQDKANICNSWIMLEGDFSRQHFLLICQTLWFECWMFRTSLWKVQESIGGEFVRNSNRRSSRVNCFTLVNCCSRTKKTGMSYFNLYFLTTIHFEKWCWESKHYICMSRNETSEKNERFQKCSSASRSCTIVFFKSIFLGFVHWLSNYPGTTLPRKMKVAKLSSSIPKSWESRFFWRQGSSGYHFPEMLEYDWNIRQKLKYAVMNVPRKVLTDGQ